MDDKYEQNTVLQSRETIQSSFFVDLQDTSKKIEENDLKIEKKLENTPQEKKSIFSKIFGLKSNVKNESNSTKEDQNIADINNNLEDKEKDTLQNLSNQSIEEIKSESEFDLIDDYNNYDGETESERIKEDDLLQIPAFLRRQAN